MPQYQPFSASRAGFVPSPSSHFTKRLNVRLAWIIPALWATTAGAAEPVSDVDFAAQLTALQAQVARLEKALAQTHAQAARSPAELDNKVRAIERRLEVAAEEATANRLKTPVVSLGEKGLSILSPDANFELKLRGYLQTDARAWLGDDNADDVDSLLARRARPIFEGTVFKNFYYRIMPDFAGAAVSLQDAYVEWRQLPFAKVTAGKFKAPFGLERLASATELPFAERGLTNNLVPNRDFGLMLNGEILGGVVNYAAGVFNGVPDLASAGANDASDEKDFNGRLFVLPFLNHYGVFQGLGFGISGTVGKEEGSAAAPALASYVTPGQARMFRYRTTAATTALANAATTPAGGGVANLAPVLGSTAVADGDRYRWSPQGYWYWHQFGILGDYVASSQEVLLGTRRDRLTNTAWQLTGSWVLTGEDASYKSVKPKINFDPLNGGWGALELVARYGELDIDDDAFAGVTASGLGNAFADPRTSISQAHSFGVGLNWYFNKSFKLQLSYDQSSFEGGGGGTPRVPLNRENEHVLLTRFQIAY